MDNYFTSIHDTPLDVFKSVQIHNDVKYLLIDGIYDEDKAKNAWLELFDEYQEAVNSKSNNTAFELNKQFHILTGEYQITKACLFILSHKLEVNMLNELMPIDLKYELLEYETEVKILNQYGFRFDINKMEHELVRCEKLSKSKKTKINILKQKIEADAKGGGKSTISDTIFIAQKHQGFPFTKESKVIDLVTCLNDLMKHNEIQKAHNKKK
jgi:hypothetical protein